jgi:amino acid transporter
MSASALLLIFAYGGYEVVPVVAGEAKDPRRGVPFALIMVIVLVTFVLTLAQLVCLSVLPDLAASRTPLADASARLMGPAGAAMITVAALMSTSGNNMGQALSGSRNLYALAEQQDLPPFFGRIHARFRTPVNAIVTTAAVSLVLAVSGTFVTMAAASAISRLVVYVATCAATLRLRNPAFAGIVQPAMFTVPGGPVIPIAAIIVAVLILVGATPTQLAAGALALFAGAVLFVIAVRGGRRA